ncbi:hypothetical protein ON010_g16708 [Phytophthora cinnamomi]|nr:hypothetical protein ON010_g16708 [Phytophthora cinnamomi]
MTSTSTSSSAAEAPPCFRCYCKDMFKRTIHDKVNTVGHSLIASLSSTLDFTCACWQRTTRCEPIRVSAVAALAEQIVARPHGQRRIRRDSFSSMLGTRHRDSKRRQALETRVEPSRSWPTPAMDMYKS